MTGRTSAGSICCPVCNTKLFKPVEATGPDGDRIECPRCGPFVIGGTASAMLRADEWTAMRRAVISHQIRIETDKGQSPFLGSDVLHRVRDGIYVLPSPLQQTENALRVISKHVQDTGDPLERTDEAFCARIGALNLDRAATVVRDMIERHWLLGDDASTFDGKAYTSIVPTSLGWEKYLEITEALANDAERPGPPDTTHIVFVGYRRADTADVAGRIYDRLEERFGVGRVFKDVDSIPLGTTFREYVRDAIGQCRVFLALIGPGWANAVDDQGTKRLNNPEDLVRIEIETALAIESVQVVPVLINNTAMPSREQLPPSLHRLCDLNAEHVRRDPDFRHDMDRLIRALNLGDVAKPVGPRGQQRTRMGTSKYQGLRDHLSAQRSGTVAMTLSEIERAIQTALPESAKRDRTWWANTRHPSRVQARAWLDAGYLVRDVDLGGSRVTFAKDE